MSLTLSGCLVGSGGGKSGIGTSSHLSRAAQQRYSPKHRRAAEKQYPQAIVLLFRKWFTGRGSGDEAWCVLIKTICPLAFKVA